MKRLLILTALAMFAVATTGCSRGWCGWFNRGAQCDECNSCATEGMYEGAIMPPTSSTPVYTLPGPASTTP